MKYDIFIHEFNNLITVYITYYEMIYYFKGEEEKRIYYSNFKLFYLLILYKLFCQRCFQIENEIFTSLIDRLLLKLWIFSKFFFKVSLSRRLTDLRISIHLFFTSLKNQLKTSWKQVRRCSLFDHKTTGYDYLKGTNEFETTYMEDERSSRERNGVGRWSLALEPNPEEERRGDG